MVKKNQRVNLQDDQVSLVYIYKLTDSFANCHTMSLNDS